MELIRKHVAIRNSIQHNSGRIGPLMLKELGVESIQIRTERGVDSFDAGSRIILTITELEGFAATLRELAEHLSAHVDMRVPEKHWITS